MIVYKTAQGYQMKKRVPRQKSDKLCLWLQILPLNESQILENWVHIHCYCHYCNIMGSFFVCFSLKSLFFLSVMKKRKKSNTDYSYNQYSNIVCLKRGNFHPASPVFPGFFFSIFFPDRIIFQKKKLDGFQGNNTPD